MSWARIDDNFADHPKVVGLPLDAVGLWTLSLAWAHRHARAGENQGLVPSAVVTRLAGPRGKRLAAQLVEVGLWHSSPTGFLIHDFAHYLPREPSHEQRVEAGRRGGRKRAQNRSKGQAESKQPASNLLDETSSKGQAESSSRVGLPSVASRPEGSPLRVEPPEPVRPTAGAALALAAVDDQPAEEPDNRTPGQRLMGEYADSCRVRPPQTHLGHVAKHVGALLEEGFDIDAVRGGLRLLRERGRHPSLLPDLVQEVVNPPTPRVPRSTTADRVAQGLDVARRLAAQEAR